MGEAITNDVAADTPTEGEVEVPDHPAEGREEAEEETSAAGKQQHIDELTSPQRLHQAASDARDFADVVRQFGSGQRLGMFVERGDTLVQGDLVMQFGVGAAVDATRESPQSSKPVPISDEEIRRVRHVYQRPVAYARCYTRLKEHHLVVLLGRAHAGKRATAAQLALEVLGENEHVLEYGPNINLEDQLESPPWQSNTAYLIDGLLAERVQNLFPQTLRGIAHTLAQIGSYMIICAAPDVHPHRDVIREFGVRLDPPPVSASVLLERHLSYYAEEDFSLGEIQGLLRRPELEPILQHPMSPQGADDLSQRLLRVLRGELGLEEAFQGSITAVEREGRDWFEEAGNDVEERAFRLALAVFSGARYAAVWEAAQDLAQRLVRPLPQEPDKPPPSPPYPFAQRRTSRLGRTRAHLEWIPEPGGSVRGSRIQAVRLDDPAYTSALVLYVWDEYVELRHTLLDWLSDYVVSHTSDVRTRAAAAIGILATFDLVTIRNQVLVPWALKEDRVYRVAIGKALGMLVWDDERASDVLALLEDWGEHKKQAFRWAAARAFGEVGLRYPRRALELWRAVLLHPEDEFEVGITKDWQVVFYKPLHMSVLDTIVNFFVAAVQLPERYRPVYDEALEGLKAWCDQDREERLEKRGIALGLPIFVILTAVRVGDLNIESDSDTWPPAMLVLLGDDETAFSYRATLADLFRRALNWRVTHKLALLALEDWLMRVDHNPHLENPIISLLQDVALSREASPRDRGRMAAYLHRWGDRPRNPRQTAKRAYQVLGL